MNTKKRIRTFQTQCANAKTCSVLVNISPVQIITVPLTVLLCIFCSRSINYLNNLTLMSQNNQELQLFQHTHTFNLHQPAIYLIVND